MASPGSYKILEGATIVASGKTVALWGVKALDAGRREYHRRQSVP
jgi:hypothetical protein